MNVVKQPITLLELVTTRQQTLTHTGFNVLKQYSGML